MKYRVQVHELIERASDIAHQGDPAFLAAERQEGQVVFSNDLDAKPNYEKLLAACRPARIRKPRLVKKA